MENIEDILPALEKRAHGQRNASLLFHFTYSKLDVRGIFFGRPLTLLVGIPKKNVGWQCDVSNGRVSERIPSEAYRVIGDVLVGPEGERSNAAFFRQLKQALAQAASSNELDNCSVTDEQILTLLKACRTGDKAYDPDGERPFFDHWRRVRPGKDSLNKIQRHFGRSVREFCYQHAVTGVWTAEPKSSSLLFLTPDIATKEITRAKCT
ncbi:hypothetical protein [Solilutibacter silvestris]|uniref:Uncharacterized protein n=1 Tax=Solilutibacter silvestris TaxID=1645665 RepID=A0A2K1Q011_9GAMM|nr:hypothetical protein [Lysobacter silvestris]PNS08381.1 hypothetical protein Lysil_0010 [Lysobacter silvestris]